MKLKNKNSKIILWEKARPQIERTSEETRKKSGDSEDFTRVLRMLNFFHLLTSIFWSSSIKMSFLFYIPSGDSLFCLVDDHCLHPEGPVRGTDVFPEKQPKASEEKVPPTRRQETRLPREQTWNERLEYHRRRNEDTECTSMQRTMELLLVAECFHERVDERRRWTTDLSSQTIRVEVGFPRPILPKTHRLTDQESIQDPETEGSPTEPRVIVCNLRAVFRVWEWLWLSSSPRIVWRLSRPHHRHCWWHIRKYWCFWNRIIWILKLFIK